MISSLRDSGLFVWPILIVRTSPTRCGVPDVCVTVQKPSTDVLERPPLICIEILSRQDEMSNAPLVELPLAYVFLGL